MKLEAILLAVVLALLTLCIRVLFVLWRSTRPYKIKKRKSDERCPTLIVLGSGKLLVCSCDSSSTNKFNLDQSHCTIREAFVVMEG